MYKNCQTYIHWDQIVYEVTFGFLFTHSLTTLLEGLMNQLKIYVYTVLNVTSIWFKSHCGLVGTVYMLSSFISVRKKILTWTP